MRKGAAVRRVEGPAGIHAAGNHRVQRERRANDVNVPAQQVDARKRQIARADHHRHQKVPQRRRDRRHQEEEHHDHAVHGEELVVGFRRDQARSARSGSAASVTAKKPPTKNIRVIEIRYRMRDAFMVVRQQPRFHAVVDVQVVQRASLTAARVPGISAITVVLIFCHCPFRRLCASFGPSDLT